MPSTPMTVRLFRVELLSIANRMVGGHEKGACGMCRAVVWQY